ncbi:hypothetical protein HY338_00085 [Candidatus Gottesmanbacteria bacterium]|nr:hypothetical protein [Candidatus Gottesmanbacteria bacterium]
MNKILTAKIILLILFLVIMIGKNNHLVLADWYTRSDIRPTQPSLERNLPTTIVIEPTVETQVTPTTTAVTPPPIGDPGVTNTPVPTAVPTATPDNNSSSTSSNSENDSSESTASYIGPQVLGLSDTAGEGLQPSDIILLAGVLCLTLYLRSKLTIKHQD